MKKITLLLGASVLALASVSAGSAAMAAPNPMSESILAAPLPTVPDSALKLPVAGTLSDGRPFAGTLSITKFALGSANEILVSGVLDGIIGNGEDSVIGQAVDSVPTTVKAPTNGCDVLNLDLKPLHLDLLGLVVDLQEVKLDVVAQPGPGNLVGNLLCAVVGLLDNPLDGILKVIDIIGKINDILGGKK